MILAFLMLSFLTCVDEPEDSAVAVRASVTTAKQQYDQEIQEADKTILKKFDAELDAAKRKGDTDAVQSWVAKRAEFLAERITPDGVATFAYFSQVRSARRSMVINFRGAIKRAYAIEDEELANEIHREFKDFRAESRLDWLQPGDCLSRGDMMISSDGRFELLFTSQGNLELSVIDGNPTVVWSVDAKNKGAIRFTMGYDGNLVLKDNKQKILFSSNTSWTKPGKLVLQGDGNLVLFDHDAKVLWASGSDQ